MEAGHWFVLVPPPGCLLLAVVGVSGGGGARGLSTFASRLIHAAGFFVGCWVSRGLAVVLPVCVLGVSSLVQVR